MCVEGHVRVPLFYFVIFIAVCNIDYENKCKS